MTCILSLSHLPYGIISCVLFSHRRIWIPCLLVLFLACQYSDLYSLKKKINLWLLRENGTFVSDLVSWFPYSAIQYNTIQYNVIAYCQCYCTRNVWWCQLTHYYILLKAITIIFSTSKLTQTANTFKSIRAVQGRALCVDRLLFNL